MTLPKPPAYIEGPWSRQARHPQFGVVYQGFHSLIAYTVDRLDWKTERFPMFKFGELPDDLIASFEEIDDFGFPDVLTLDPMKVRTALAAAEYVVHETVHCWQADIGYPLVDNRHEENFHLAMADFGIATQGISGRHVGYIGDVWDEWMAELRHLRLGEMLLSDEPAPKRLKVRTYECQICALTVHHASATLALVCSHDDASSDEPSIMKLVG